MICVFAFSFFFFFNDTATTEIYTLSLHDALPISVLRRALQDVAVARQRIQREIDSVQVEFQIENAREARSEEHTSELQSRLHLVCRLLLEKKKHKRHAEQPDSTTSDAAVPTCRSS